MLLLAFRHIIIIYGAHFMRKINGFTALFLGAVALVVLTFPINAFANDYNGPEISFAEIYANPNDQELNLNYARQQAAAGDYLTAASTLERMLFTSPNWDSARLFYALVLFKLDDREAAERELSLLNSRPLTDQQRTQVLAYRNSIKGNSNETPSNSLKGKIAVGMRYDDNAGNALADTLLTFANRDDISAFIQGTASYSNPIGDNGLKFNAGVNGQIRRHKTFSSADYDTFGGRVGMSGDFSDGLAWSADILASQVNISGEKYLSQTGGRLMLKKVLSEQTGVWLRGTWYDQNYNNLSFTSVEPTRSGNKISVAAGVIHKLNSDSFIGVSIGYEDKKAKNAAFAYDGFRLNGRFHKGFGNGLYLNGRATYRMIKYDGNSFLNPAPTRREDDHVSARLGLGASLSTIGSWLGMSEKSADSFGLETGINYTNRSSNNTLLKYKNVGADLKLVWNF